MFSFFSSKPPLPIAIDTPIEVTAAQYKLIMGEDDTDTALGALGQFAGFCAGRRCEQTGRYFIKAWSKHAIPYLQKILG